MSQIKNNFLLFSYGETPLQPYIPYTTTLNYLESLGKQGVGLPCTTIHQPYTF